MLECRRSLYFYLIRGLHGILIDVCSPNYSWVSSLCPSSQTCQMCVLKIKGLAFLLPTRHMYAPRVPLGVERELHTSECLSTSRHSTGHQYEFPNSLSSVRSPNTTHRHLHFLWIHVFIKSVEETKIISQWQLWIVLSIIHYFQFGLNSAGGEILGQDMRL